MIPAPVILIIVCCLASSCTSRNSTEQIQEQPEFNGLTLKSVKDTNTVKRYKWEVFYNELTEKEKRIIDSVTKDPYWITWDFVENCKCDSINKHKLFFPTRNKETIHVASSNADGKQKN